MNGVRAFWASRMSSKLIMSVRKVIVGFGLKKVNGDDQLL
jgi:hypothetical protein